jgi:hypothetical protein
MGNNNYQFRLQSLEVLDDYISKLRKEVDFCLGYPKMIKDIHLGFSESDRWNDVKHTEFFEQHIEEIGLKISELHMRMEEAINRLNQLKGIYANAGVN